MQYIEKQTTPPNDWEKWFTTANGVRSFDYKKDYNSLTNVKFAKAFLLGEQHGLCAYCQQVITLENASIEHVTPKEHNVNLSTNYFNLVAVCKTQIKDSEGKVHCDKQRLSSLISPIIFYGNAEANDSKTNSYFGAYADGSVFAKHNLDEQTKKQVEAFIEVLNLNHTQLKETRAKEVLDGINAIFISLPQQQKKAFWKNQYERILQNKSHPFRQFLLSYIGSKIGIN